ncbi:hypothetical protein P3S67_007042 [Capsicum chacoense]
MSIRKSFFPNVFLFATFITSCVAQSNTTTTLCVPFYCKDDLLIDVIMVIKYLVGVVILIAVVVWQYKRRNMNTWNDGLENNRASSNEQNC